MSDTEQPGCPYQSSAGLHCELDEGHPEEECQRTYNNRVVKWRYQSPWNRPLEPIVSTWAK